MSRAVTKLALTVEGIQSPLTTTFDNKAKSNMGAWTLYLLRGPLMGPTGVYGPCTCCVEPLVGLSSVWTLYLLCGPLMGLSSVWTLYLLCRALGGPV